MKCPRCGFTFEKFRNPVPTVDVIIRIGEGIVLVNRKNPPAGWALPGGFVDYGETLEQAAAREAFEETGLNIVLKEQFRSYSNPDRDPRQHTISTVFLAEASGKPTGGDDAVEAALFPLDQLPPLAFDHEKIINDYRQSTRTRS